MLKRAFLLVLLCFSLALGGCAALDVAGESVSSAPNLALLQMAEYTDEETALAQRAEAGVLRVDLWLSASQLMGGVSDMESSMYPHYSRRYREGGFHYRYGNEVGWYQSVLCDMLATAEGTFTRVMRVGNERLPDEKLVKAGLAVASDEAALRSARRDLLTYATSPMPTLFDEFTSEKMQDSFYTLGTPKLNQMARFAPSGGSSLENPGQVDAMSALLDEQIAAIASEEREDWALPVDDVDCPLMYALQNIDLSRLSVIVFDPAELRCLTDTDASGKTVDYLRELLDERGLFDAGLSVGLYAFRLDYMGQMTSFGAVRFSEPIIWGSMKYNNNNKKDTMPLPMPRQALALVVGSGEQVRSYTAALSARMDADADLRGLRGPQKGELSYVANGQTVTQQPFTFAYEYMSVARPDFSCLTQHTVGMTIEAQGGETLQNGSLATVRLSADTTDPTITLTFPLANTGDVAVDLRNLGGGVEVKSALLLQSVLPNTPETKPDAGDSSQVITVRDKVYLFESLDAPFEGDAAQSPFTLASIAPDTDGATLVATVSTDTSKLKPGYYRLCVRAELSGSQLMWPDVSWIDAVGGLDATFTNDQIAEWESFSALIEHYEGGKNSVTKQFQHAWGPLSERSYHGESYPDFPPVYLAPNLRELARQLRAAANVDAIPYVRCVFDVFVDEVKR